MRIPHYLVKNHNGIYYFRYVIPQIQRHHFPNNKREYRRSLKTHCKSEAIKRAKYYWVTIMTSISNKNMQDPDTEMRRELEMLRIGASVQHQISIHQEEYEKTYFSDPMDMYIGSLSDYEKECLDIHTQHEYARENSRPDIQANTTLPPNNPITPRKRIDDLVTTFLNDKKEFIEPKTYADYQQQFKLFLRIIKIEYVEQLTIEVVQTYKEILPKLPPRMNQMKNTRNKSIDEILSLGLNRIAYKTLHKNLVSVSGFLTWLHQQLLVTQDFSSILHGVKNTSKRKDGDKTDTFTLKDLEAMFSTEEYQHSCFKGRAFRYWLPLLALYTGARANELCQLFVSDVYKDNGIDVLRMEDQSDEKKLKNIQSNRIVPVHKKLIELGFIDYVALMNSQGQKQLFPTLKPDIFGHRTKNISKFFNSEYQSYKGFLDRCGIYGSDAKGRKVFHSFRHTFINNAKQLEINLYMIKQISGHASDDMTMDTYGDDYNLDLLKKNIDKIKFDVQHPKRWHRHFL